MMDACIGQHLRHSLDHVNAILDGAESGVIDYDHRERGGETLGLPTPRALKIAQRPETRGPASSDRKSALTVICNGDGDDALFVLQPLP